MKVALLAGGLGTRLAEETSSRPKPMVEIGGRPILWHIMHIYAHHGYNDFIVACGFKGEMIKDYFLNFSLYNNDYQIQLKNGSRKILGSSQVDWQVSVIDTGQDTLTGGRLLRLKQWLGGEQFMLTYGDGVGNIDVTALVDYHCSHGKIATVTAARPPSRFGALNMEGNRVKGFSEKPMTEAGWINGGFFVFEPEIFEYLEGDNTILERSPLEQLSKAGQLMAYKHQDFWQPMDTLRDKQHLEALWNTRKAPWRAWNN